MPVCSEMKKGDIYVCEECGLEIQIIRECTECGTADSECSDETCDFVCCNQPLELKK